MSKDDTPSPGGLLSKVARFVRNPTVNWSELDSLETERESQYNKQVLKDMLERKRRNDFVRRREFDQLRKLRQLGMLSEQRSTEIPVRTSMFHSSMASSDERAVTIRKIDEIEAQMSRQWWKSTDTGTQSHADAAPVVATDKAADLPQADAAPHAFLHTAPLTLPFSLANTDDGSAGQALAFVPPEQPAFVHDPDLEEAAILFANGDSTGAEASLLDMLAQRAAEPPPQQLELWMTLFDLYRATGQQDRFDVAGLDFAARFHRSGPLWFSLPEQLGLDAARPDAAPDNAQVQRVWNAPAQLTAQSVAALQAWLERNPMPWTLSWSRLDGIDDNALMALTGLFSRWAAQPVHLVFTNADAFHALLQAHTVSGNGASNAEWWLLRMAALRCMNQPDAFEMVALDYCVTYEVSPPSWQAPQCTLQDAVQSAPASGDGTSTPAPPADTRPASHWSDPTQPLTLPGHSYGAAIALPMLEGQVTGDAAELLDALVAGSSPDAGLLRISCEHLVRLDFAAAGSVLNWAARQQELGRTVRFEQLHRLAAVFFSVIGIHEYAAVQPRDD